MSTTFFLSSSEFTTSIVVRWNDPIDEDRFNTPVSLKLENATWLKETPSIWYFGKSQFVIDSREEIEFVRPEESNLSQKQFFRLKNRDPAKIKLRASAERASKVFTMTKDHKHSIIDLYPQGAELAYFQEGLTTLQMATHTVYHIAGITQNVTENAYGAFVSVPGALSRVATRIGATASKIIYG